MSTAPAAHHDALGQVLAASADWIRSFNAGDARACADAYTADAWMEARPFGRFEGREAIHEFWSSFLATGAGELRYREVVVRALDDDRVRLESSWSMNVGRGVITEELWTRQADGRWRLAADAFEVREQYER